MQANFKTKLLQHLLKQRQTGGFTLIELLVVIIIIGILAAIALPSFLNQANRARQSEAQTYAGSVNRGQQAYRLENTSFADQISRLGLGINTETEFYTYGDRNANADATQEITDGSGSYSNNAAVWAYPKDDALLSYAGITYTLQDQQDNTTTTALLCTSEEAFNGDDANIVEIDDINGDFGDDPVVESTNGDCGED